MPCCGRSGRAVATRNGAKAVEYGKRIKIYPLSKADNPPPTTYVDAAGVLYDATIPYDIRYFESLNRVIQHEPWLERDRAMIDTLRTLGIERGKPSPPMRKWSRPSTPPPSRRISTSTGSIMNRHQRTFCAREPVVLPRALWARLQGGLRRVCGSELLPRRGSRLAALVHLLHAQADGGRPVLPVGIETRKASRSMAARRIG